MAGANGLGNGGSFAFETLTPGAGPVTFKLVSTTTDSLSKSLEPRQMMALFAVTTLEDAGAGSLLPASTPSANRPAGELTSFASPAGTLNVRGAAEDGDVIRTSWRQDLASVWSAENLSELAERV